MSPETSPVLDRLHEVLVEEIRENRPELLDRSFTVAEIYQNLVPYRSHRDRIGVEMNADYEHALLELLAGEGDYLVLESRAALRQIREELESLNPDTGIYRDFAAVDVHLNPENRPESEAAEGRDDAPSPEAPETIDASEPAAPVRQGAAEGEAETEFAFVDDVEDEASAVVAGDPPEASAEPGELELGAPDSGADGGSPDRNELPGDGACRWCRGELPDRDDLHYCPHCGSPVDRVPCPECGTELDPEWRFCVACGTDVESG